MGLQHDSRSRVLRSGDSDDAIRIDRRLSVPTAGIFAAGAIVLSMLWAQDSGAAANESKPGQVSISDFAFHESEVFVTTGSEVTWTNGDGFAHSVVATDGAFHSDSLGTGDSFTTTFDTAGTYTYVCGIHGAMTGTVVVTD